MLILTGQLPPTSFILAEELEIPILSVDLDTLTTVELLTAPLVKCACTNRLRVNAFAD